MTALAQPCRVEIVVKGHHLTSPLRRTPPRRLCCPRPGAQPQRILIPHFVRRRLNSRDLICRWRLQGVTESSGERCVLLLRRSQAAFEFRVLLPQQLRFGQHPPSPLNALSRAHAAQSARPGGSAG